MTEKVRVTQEQADAIEYLTTKGFWSQEELIKLQAEKFVWEGPRAKGLNGMPLLTFVDALRIGYEIEPEFKVGDWVVPSGIEKYFNSGYLAATGKPCNLLRKRELGRFLPNRIIHLIQGRWQFMTTNLSKPAIVKCEDCKGLGTRGGSKLIWESCYKCEGTGRVQKDKHEED